MINAPLGFKLLIPGYRRKWRRQYSCMISELQELAPILSYGEDGEAPWIELNDSGLRFFGFWTEKKNIEVYRILKGSLPKSIPVEYFRLAKDCLNRYVYPHMLPGLKPNGYSTDKMFGFHGQHKDSIADIEDEETKVLLYRIFTPKPDDIIIDCGSFLGFGELRVAPEVRAGHIFAVEADNACHELLVRNLEYNKIKNVTSINRAIWNSETELDLQSDFAQANTLVPEVHKGQFIERVKTITIDSLVRDHVLTKVDMLSLTLNGAEVEALEGAKQTLENFRPRIRLAGWYSRDGRKIADITRERLVTLGYEVFVGPRGNILALPR